MDPWDPPARQYPPGYGVSCACGRDVVFSPWSPSGGVGYEIYEPRSTAQAPELSQQPELPEQDRGPLPEPVPLPVPVIVLSDDEDIQELPTETCYTVYETFAQWETVPVLPDEDYSFPSPVAETQSPGEVYPEGWFDTPTPQSSPESSEEPWSPVQWDTSDRSDSLLAGSPQPLSPSQWEDYDEALWDAALPSPAADSAAALAQGDLLPEPEDDLMVDTEPVFPPLPTEPFPDVPPPPETPDVETPSTPATDSFDSPDS